MAGWIVDGVGLGEDVTGVGHLRKVEVFGAFPVSHLPLVRRGVHAVDASRQVGGPVGVDHASALIEGAAGHVGRAVLEQRLGCIPRGPHAVAGLVGLVDQCQVAGYYRSRAAGAAPGLPRFRAVKVGGVVELHVARAAAAVPQDVQARRAVAVGSLGEEGRHVTVHDLVGAHDRIPVGRAELGRRAGHDCCRAAVSLLRAVAGAFVAGRKDPHAGRGDGHVKRRDQTAKVAPATPHL